MAELLTDSEAIRTSTIIKVPVRDFPVLELLGSNTPPGWPKHGVVLMTFQQTGRVEFDVINAGVLLTKTLDILN